MIEITSDKTEVLCKVTGYRPVNWVFPCSFRCGDETYAILLARELQTQLASKMRAIKEAAYERGWNDKRRNRRKQKTFCGNWARYE